ncbi:bifunctional diguanylate cyclase/phosphodiesterase [Thiohalobacter thiocyanaticus]|uniref:cyclic-guanylate-specific phosphodiesterase n=1 Tax=Thiohalobacter thiocyanaticus TaxID=585455 RepID=A0A426QGK6_9GAMM|nr:EAL domain-containing protein [Thiohalobacter thiocyanaticus]RRQ20888.1 EAL domain-containing protein [Thiohalobacter thiocyanaticus]
MPPILHKLIWPGRSPGRIAFFYIAGVSLWIYLSTYLLQVSSGESLLREFELTKGLGFAALTGLLLYVLLRTWGQQDSAGTWAEAGATSARFRTRLHRIFLGFTALVVLLTLLGYFIFTHERQHLEQQTYNKLQAIAELKSEQVGNWLEERYSDAQTLAGDGIFVRQAAALAAGDEAVHASLSERLSAFREAYGYEGVMIIGPDGSELLSQGIRHVMPELDPAAAGAAVPVRDSRVGHTRFFRDAHGQLHMDLIMSLPGREGIGAHAGFILIHSSPEDFLFPYIRSWPSERKSGRSLLVQQDGRLVQSLGSKYAADESYESIEYPLELPDRPGSMARGDEDSGTFQGRDYRGIQVLAAYDQVPNIDWKILVKIDRWEVLAPLYSLMRWVGLISLFALSVLAFSLLVLWRQQERMYVLSMQAEQHKNEAVREAAEKALEQSESRLRTLVRTIPDLVWLKDTEGVYLLCNSMFEKFFGATEKAIRGHTDYDFVSQSQADFFQEQDQRAMHAGEPLMNEEWLRFNSGGYYGLFETVKTPMRDSRGNLIGVLGIARDVTRRKQAEDELRLAAMVFEQSREGIIITDAEDRIIKINKAFTEITGYTETEALGQHPNILSSGRHDKAFYRRLWQAVENQGYWQGEIWNRRKDGKIYPQWLSIVRTYDANPKVRGHIAIFEDITQRKQDEERINWLAHFDALTGLPNRTLLLDRVRSAIARARRYKHGIAVLYCDLDHFKNVNDALGHSVGDGLLKEVAARLPRLVREQDTVSRQGGDEFIVLLPDTDSNGAAHVCRKIMSEISEPCSISGFELNISFSIGVSIYPDDGDDFDTLAKHADIAMYQAKQMGRNGYCFFTPELQGMTARTLKLETDIQRALDHDEFLLHYQPQVCIATGRLSGFEALLRWQHPEFGMISPAEFIPIAERSGQIVRIGEWVARTAAIRLRGWLDAGLEPVKMAVNLSVPQLQQARLFETMETILDETGLAPELLELEVTESMLMEDPEKSVAALRRLSQYGVKVAIDDFGTGYSSLAYLKRLPVNYLKIDREFIRDIPADPDDATIARSIISLGHSLGLQIIAEGVETQAQLEFLRVEGCDHMQGFLFSRPLPEAEMFDLLVGMGCLKQDDAG